MVTVIWVFAVCFSCCIMLQDFTYKHTQPGFLCQKRVWMGSTFPDLNHFYQAKNYQLLGNPNSALMVDRSSLMLPGNKQLIKAAWYLLNLPIHHFMRCPCPPLTSSASVLASPWSPSLFRLFLSPSNLIFLSAYLVSSPKWTYLSPSSAGAVVSAGFKNVPHSTFHFFFSFLSWPSTPSALPSLPLSSLLPPSVTRAQGMGGLPRSSLLLPF